MIFSDTSALIAYLRSHANPRKATFDAQLIPNLQHEILGWAVPALRQLAKDLIRTDAGKALQLTENTANLHEMILLRGFVIGYAHWEWPQKAQAIQTFIPLITDWAVCDMFCCTLTDIRKHREEGWSMLQQYIESGLEFEQRFAVVMLMEHFLTEDYFDRVINLLRGLQPAGYYASMAVGWALQAAFVHHPDRVFPLLSDTSIDLESRMLARKKILESLRTPENWRFCVKVLKIT